MVNFKQVIKFGVVSICLLILSAFVNVLSIRAEAQEIASSELLLFEEIPIVTLATRSPMEITKVPAAMSVITAEDIATSGYRNIWDLFRNLPGVDVMHREGNNAVVTLRGFNAGSADKLQVLIDGRTIFDPINSTVFWTENVILLEDIERIEIMRGPNTVLYGFNAFCGVINIITKDPEKTKGVFTKLMVGDNSTQECFGRVSDKIENLAYRLSYEHSASRGIGADEGRAWNDGKKLNAISWRSKYIFDDDKNLEAWFGRKAGHQGYLSAFHYRWENDFQQLKYNHRLAEDNNFFVQFFREYIGKSIGGICFKQYDLEFQHDFVPLEGHRLVWGGNFRRNEGRVSTTTSPLGFHHNRILRAFAQDGITVNDKLTYYCGLEWSQNNYTQSDVSTRQTLMYHLVSDHYLRATYGRAYHAFGFSQANRTNPSGGGTKLNRESVDAFELGYRGSYLDRKLLLDLQLFYNNINEIMQTVGTAYENTNYAETKGLELALDYRPYHWLKSYFNFSYLSIDDKASPSEWNSNSPKYKVNAGGRIDFDKQYLPDYLDMRISWRDTYNLYASSGYTKIIPYWVLDLKIAKKFMNDKMEIGLAGLNLIDSHYEADLSRKFDKQILATLTLEF